MYNNNTEDFAVLLNRALESTPERFGWLKEIEVSVPYRFENIYQLGLRWEESGEEMTWQHRFTKEEMLHYKGVNIVALELQTQSEKVRPTTETHMDIRDVFRVVSERLLAQYPTARRLQVRRQDDSNYEFQVRLESQLRNLAFVVDHRGNILPHQFKALLPFVETA